jgi:hypothetical protein
MNPEQKSDVTELEPVDEAGRKAAIDAFKAKAQEKAPEAMEIKQAPPGSVLENMIVGIVWKTKDGRTWIAPGMYKVKGAYHNGRINLKLIKRH